MATDGPLRLFVHRQKNSFVNTENCIPWWIIYPMESMQTNKKDRIGAVPSLILEPMVFYSISKKALNNQNPSGITIITL